MPKNDYDVGYGKPPKSGQFKPGQSGNPKGRPTGAKNLITVLEEELQAKVPIKELGKSKKVTKQEAMVKALMLKAIQGDVKAINAVVATLLKLAGPQPMEDEDPGLSKTDQQILDDFIKSMAAKTKAPGVGEKL